MESEGVLAVAQQIGNGPIGRSGVEHLGGRVVTQIDDKVRATFSGIADVLIPEAEGMPAASAVDNSYWPVELQHAPLPHVQIWIAIGFNQAETNEDGSYPRYIPLPVCSGGIAFAMGENTLSAGPGWTLDATGIEHQIFGSVLVNPQSLFVEWGDADAGYGTTDVFVLHVPATLE